eukprot:gene14849-20906_t
MDMLRQRILGGLEGNSFPPFPRSTAMPGLLFILLQSASILVWTAVRPAAGAPFIISGSISAQGILQGVLAMVGLLLVPLSHSLNFMLALSDLESSTPTKYNHVRSWTLAVSIFGSSLVRMASQTSLSKLVAHDQYVFRLLLIFQFDLSWSSASFLLAISILDLGTLAGSLYTADFNNPTQLSSILSMILQGFGWYLATFLVAPAFASLSNFVKAQISDWEPYPNPGSQMEAELLASQPTSTNRRTSTPHLLPLLCSRFLVALVLTHAAVSMLFFDNNAIFSSSMLADLVTPTPGGGAAPWGGLGHGLQHDLTCADVSDAPWGGLGHGLQHDLTCTVASDAPWGGLGHSLEHDLTCTVVPDAQTNNCMKHHLSSVSFSSATAPSC